MQCSPMWTPSTSSATRSSASSAVDRQAASCAAVFATNRRLTALLLVPRLAPRRRTGSRLRRVLARGDARRASARPRDDSADRCRRTPRNVGSGDFLAVGPHPRPANLHLPTAEHDLARDRAGARRRAARPDAAYRGPQIAVRSSSSIVVRTFRPDATASSISSARVSTRRSTRGRWRWLGESTWCDRSTVRDSRFMAAPAGGLSPWLSHRSYSTTSEEPPLSNFNSYRDIPGRHEVVLYI